MSAMAWSSDAIAELLRQLDLKYAAVVPGSSFRGLHDSLVNYLWNADPSMLVCLHEEHTVAIAHGYAKVTGQPMLAIVHANIGLMHASMACYDAWADRVPVLIIGANGPGDASKRRPWIDWLHTGRDIAAMIRSFTKWDDEPRSITAALESIVRAHQIACTPPYAPTYIVLDVAMQEEPLPGPLAMPNLARFAPPETPMPADADVGRTLDIMRSAKRPVILAGRASRSLEAWNERVILAEALNARVVGDLKVGATFPTRHPLFVGPPSDRLTASGVTALREADAILSLESVDLAGTLRQAFGDAEVTATIVACSIDRYLHNATSMDHQALPPVDLNIVVPAEAFVTALVHRLGRPKMQPVAEDAARAERSPEDAPETDMDIASFMAGLREAFAGEDVCFIRLPLATNSGTNMSFRHPLDFLGGDGGGGVGAGPGIAVGAALALRGTARLPVAVLGDGDYLMGVTALWTAVANDIPLLVVVANNACFHNDVVHQERVATVRGRPVERRWIGQMISEPAPDLAMMARAQGALGIGQVVGRAAMRDALAEAKRSLRAGKVVVVDVRVNAETPSSTRLMP